MIDRPSLPDGLNARAKRAAEVTLDASEWAGELLERRPEFWRELAESGAIERPAGDRYEQLEQALVDAGADRGALMRELRRAKARESLRIAIRDLGGLADLEETLADLTALADALIGVAHAWLTKDHESRRGVPRDAAGERLDLLVVGMGKLGGGELNFSSDIDLIFAFRAAGETDGERPEEAARFFERLGRDLAQVLSEVTEEGFVYRTDLRLRPHGASGRLALSFAAMEEYYQREGRDWERYAWVKARRVAGADSDGDALMNMMRPFVFRRYLDFQALEALRELKAQVAAEVKRQRLEDDIKLGAGGIREIEFVAQVFQLIRGGRDPALRDRKLLRTLDRLAERGLMSGTAVEELADAYVFLRRLENRLQMYRDEQTHALPRDPEHRERIARAMGAGDWSGLADRLNSHRERVHERFEAVFESREDGADDSGALDAIWQGDLKSDEPLSALGSLGFRDAEAARDALRGFRESTRVRALGARGRQRLDRFVPMLLEGLSVVDEPDRALPRVLQVLEAIVRRSVYLALLLENPPVVERLCRRCGESGWIARQLASAPLLLDELIQSQPYDPEQDWEAMHAELGRATGAVMEDDPEQQLEAIAQFQRALTLQVALAELSGELDAAQAGQQLSGLARAVLVRTLSLALGSMSRAALSREELAQSFAVIAYGRLGAGELAYDSDLDLVFLYRGGGESELTPFYMRLTRRLIHLLTTPMPGGRLYPVDTRLRPNGQAGLLVSPFSAYHDYQTNEAWTWEQQALVRARCVYGSAELADRFEKTRETVLRASREPEELRASVARMRDRMRRERGDSGNELKQGPGGLVDLEFIVQYEVLAGAHDHPELARQAGTPALLRTLSRVGAMPEDEAAALGDAWMALLGAMHRVTLEAAAPDGDLDAHRDVVRESWERRFGGLS